MSAHLSAATVDKRPVLANCYLNPERRIGAGEGTAARNPGQGESCRERYRQPLLRQWLAVVRCWAAG